MEFLEEENTSFGQWHKIIVGFADEGAEMTALYIGESLTQSDNKEKHGTILFYQIKPWLEEAREPKAGTKLEDLFSEILQLIGLIEVTCSGKTPEFVPVIRYFLYDRTASGVWEATLIFRQSEECQFIFKKQGQLEDYSATIFRLRFFGRLVKYIEVIELRQKNRAALTREAYGEERFFLTHKLQKQRTSFVEKEEPAELTVIKEKSEPIVRLIAIIDFCVREVVAMVEVDLAEAILYMDRPRRALRIVQRELEEEKEAIRKDTDTTSHLEVFTSIELRMIRISGKLNHNKTWVFTGLHHLLGNITSSRLVEAEIHYLRSGRSGGFKSPQDLQSCCSSRFHSGLVSLLLQHIDASKRLLKKLLKKRDRLEVGFLKAEGLWEGSDLDTDTDDQWLDDEEWDTEVDTDADDQWLDDEEWDTEVDTDADEEWDKEEEEEEDEEG